MRLAGKWRRLPITTLYSIGLAGFLAGLGLSRLAVIDSSWILILLVILFVVYKLKNPLFIVVITLLGLSIGMWRGGQYMHKLQPYKDLSYKRVIVEGRVDSDGVYGDKSQLTFDITNLQLLSPVSQPMVGTIAVKGFGPSMVYRGNIVRVEAKLYPTRGSRQASLSFADISLIRSSTTTFDSFRRNFLAGLQSALPEPLASFAAGLLIGQRSTLPSEVNNDLKSTGLTHIVAVSGYNLTIIIYAVHRLLRKRSKYQSTVISLLAIGAFLLISGFSASIIRAAIVSVLSLGTWYYGRKIKPVLLILLAAAITAGWYPLYLWSDIGWYLSFLAFFGVLVIAPLFLARVYRGKKQPNLIGQVVAETMSAQVMALPLIMYIFGEVSLVALFANVLVVPLVPLGMLLALLAGLAGMWAAPIAGWFAWPAQLILTYMLDVVHMFASIPHALATTRLYPEQLILIYMIVMILVLVMWHRSQQKDATITDVNQQST